MMTYPSTIDRWVAVHIPENFKLGCPPDFDADRYLVEVLMVVNLADQAYQIPDILESVSHSFLQCVGSDDTTEDDEEYAWCLGEQALIDAQQLFDSIKPILKQFETPEGLGVDIPVADLEPTGILFKIEEV